MNVHRLLIAAIGLSLSSPAWCGAVSRPMRISGTTEGALKVEKDPRYTDFLYYASGSGSEVRVWAGKGRTVKPGQPPSLERDNYSELMYILEGSVTLAEPDGTKWLLKVGDCAIVPRGVPYYWQLPTGQWVKKVYVVFDQDKAESAVPYKHIIRLETSSLENAGSKEADGTSKGHAFYDNHGNSAGVWQTKPYVGGIRSNQRPTRK